MGTDIRRYTYTNNDYVYSHNNRIKTDVCKYHIRRSSSMLLVTFKNQYQSPEKNKKKIKDDCRIGNTKTYRKKKKKKKKKVPKWQKKNLKKKKKKKKKKS